MQDRYAGDVGDFGKYALLKALAQDDLRLGINWYLNAGEEANNDGGFVDYRHLRECDPVLHDSLQLIVKDPSRGVAAVQRAGILPADSIFFSEPLPDGRTADYRHRRNQWSEAALSALAKAGLIFLDPDNGISHTSLSAENGNKYVEEAELLPYGARGQSLIVYQHQTRNPGGLAVTVPQALMMFRSMGCLKSWALVFRRRSVRVYYVIPCQRHLEALRACTADFLQSRWGCDGHFELVESDRGGASMDKSSSATKPTSLKQHLEDVSATSILESSPMRLELDQPDRAGIQRGMRLFHYLADRANDGDAVGISYGRFIAYIHGGTDFRQIAHRNYLPSDSGIAVRIALSITEEAGGRVVIFRADRSIQAGMDTFIWNGARPFDRPPRAWLSRFHIPYTREDWLVVFPSGARQMISPAELETLEQRK